MKFQVTWLTICMLFISMLCPNILFAQKNTFAYYVPGVDFEGNCIVKVNSNKFIIGGAYDNETFLLAIDSSGAILWDLKFDVGAGNESVSDLKLTSDGYVIGCGWYTPNDRSGVIFKIDHNLGSLIWSGVSSNQSMFYDIHELPSNGNYVITGSRSGVPLKALIMEFDKTNGNLLWQKLYETGNSSTESFISSIIHNGALYTTGRYEIGSGGTSTYRPTISKFDFSGTELWSKYYLVPVANPARLYGQNISTHGGGLIVSINGNFTGGTNASQNAIIKTDDNGNILWAKRQSHVGYPELQLRDIESYNGRIYSTGWAIDSGRDFVVAEINASGDLIKTVALQGLSLDGSWRNSLTFEGNNLFGVFHSRNLSATSNYEVIVANFNLDLTLDTTCHSLFSLLADNNVAMPSPFETTTSLTLIPSSITVPSVVLSTNNPPIQVRILDEVPEIDLGPDTVICGNSILLDPSTINVDTYIWNNGSSDSTLLAVNSGNYWCIVTHSNGCTAVDSINVDIGSSTLLTVDTTICDGDSYFAGGAWQITAGTYYDTISIPGLCDSIIRTNLSLITHTSFVIDTAICDGQSIFAGGTLQTSPGTYYDTVMVAGSCDSIVRTNLSVITSTIVMIDTTICDGQAILVGGSWQTQAGSYYDTLLNVIQCDSIVITDLSIAFPSTTTVDTSICDGESYFAGGQWQSMAGIYTDTLLDVNNCDSIIHTDLNIAPKPVIDIGNDTSLCFGNSLSLSVSDPLAMSYLWQNGSTNSALQTSNSGVYWVIASSAFGCSGTDSLTLSLIPNDQTLIDSAICAGDSIQFSGQFISDPGIYRDTLINLLGCDSIISLDLRSEDSLKFDLGPDLLICEGDQVTLQGPIGSQLYVWSDGSAGNSILVSAAGIYWLNAFGVCNSFSDSVEVETDDSDFYIWVPNCFSPNNDGINETFRTPGFKVLEYHLMIFNRWGQLLFESNSIDKGWDGTYKGANCPDGTYVYMLNYNGHRCGELVEEDKKGWITIFR